MSFFGSNWDENSDSDWNIDKRQYIIYGIVVPYMKELIEMYGQQNDIFGIFYGRDGKFIILGKILVESDSFGTDKPFIIPNLNKIDELIVQQQVFEKFGVEGKFNYYFVAK